MNRLIFTSLASVLLLSGGALAAQETASPSLTARIDGVVGAETQALEIERLAIEVERHGSLAMTELTVTFANPTDTTLEGQFGMDLPRGSVVTGYALDVAGAMIDGVLQSRDRAREAFERRVVQRIDPGLAEVDFSDRFETRVYPIFPRQGRTIRIRFASPLDETGRYDLPLAIDTVRNYDIVVRGIRPDGGAGIAWAEQGGRWTAQGQGGLSGAIRFAAAPRDGLTVSEHPGEGRFFELAGSAPQAASRDRNANLPGPLTIVWDRSVSRLDDDHDREAAFAQTIARNMGVQNVDIVLLDSEGQPETVTARTGRLAEMLKAVRYAGGTRYEGLAQLLAGRGGTCLLFSDGRATLGERPSLTDGSGTGSACRLVAVSSGPERDAAWLQSQAEAAGGVAIDLAAVSNEEALEAALRPAGIPVVTGSDGRPVFARRLPSAAGRYRLVGPMPADGRLFVNGEAMTAPSPVVPTFAAPGALWAQQHLTNIRDGLGIEALAEEARRWSVAVPGVSFIVLETPADYVESGFVPPDSYPKDLRAQYDAIRQQQARADAAANTAYYDRLLALWAERKRWWTEGTPPNAARSGPKAEEGQPLPPPPTAIRTQQLPEPPPPPPPPPPPQAAVAQVERGESIIVTGSRITNESVDMAMPVSGAASDAMGAAADVVVPEDAAKSSDTGQIMLAEEWAADRPYIRQWLAVRDGDWESVVRETEEEYGTIPLFYLDLAEWHYRAGRLAEARRAAAAALDLPTRDNQTLEIVAQRLLRYGDPEGAIWLLEQLADREAERPHPRMLLAQAHAQIGRATGDRERLITAQRMLSEIAMKRWPFEYAHVGEIALAEANGLIAELGGPASAKPILDPKWIDPMPVDIRVVAIWNTPRTDLDLWTVEPGKGGARGEEVGYSNKFSAAGGRYTDDVTRGFGPEEYQIRRAADGDYRIEINSFAPDRRNPNGPSTVTVRLIRDFGTASPKEEVIDIEMQPDAQGRRLVGTIAAR